MRPVRNESGSWHKMTPVYNAVGPSVARESHAIPSKCRISSNLAAARMDLPPRTVAGLGLLCLPLFAAPTRADRVALVKDGVARAVIFVPARLLDDPTANPEPASVWRSLKPEDNRRRLRESVRGPGGRAEEDIRCRDRNRLRRAPTATEKRLPTLIGELAAERFGKSEKAYPYDQGFRITASDRGVGLAGGQTLLPAMPSTLCSTNSAAAGTCRVASVKCCRPQRRSTCLHKTSPPDLTRSTAASGTATTISPAAIGSAVWN